MTINRSQQMLINAICLYHAPEVVKFAAIFSDMTELLEECMGNFVQAVSNGQADIQPGTFFNDELADLAGDFIDQVQDQADDIIADYGHLLDEMAATGGLAQAQECVDQIKTTLPGLVPLDQPAAAKDLLAYLGFMDKENPYSRLLFNFLDCFKPVFSFIEEEQRREREEEQQQQHNWFAAAEKNDTAALLPLLEDVDITLTNNDSLTALAVAASLDHAETVRLLLEHGATPHDSFSSHSPAVLAVRNNSTRALQSMLDSNHSELQKVNWKSLLEDICQDDRLAVFSLILAHIDDEFDLSELAARAIRNHAGLILQHLLKQGLAASATRFSTPLSFIALEESNTTALELLLDNGTDINQPDWHDRILLEKAINDDKQAFVTLLLSRGANLDATRLINLPEILEKLSVITGDRIADLIDKGIIKTARIPLLFFIIGKTSIDAAEREIVTHLLDRCDIDINLMEEDGDDNLITTCYDETLFNLLLERKPDLNVSFSDSNTLAEKLLDRFEGRAIQKCLQVGLNPNTTIYSRSLLFYSINNNCIYTTDLIERGADVNQTDKEGYSVVQRFIGEPAKLGDHLILLAQHGADFTGKTITGLPLFHALCAIYSTDTVRQIVELTDLDVNVVDKHGNTALMQALHARQLDTMVYLAGLGVNANQANALDMSPIAHAVYNNDTELMQVLIEQCNADVNVMPVGKSLLELAESVESYQALEYLHSLSAEATP